MNSSSEVVWAVVPIKSFAQAKTRLSSVLPPDDRQRLACAMADDVLSAICASGKADLLCILTDHGSQAVDELARRHGALALLDLQVASAPGLNAAIAGVANLAHSKGADTVLVIHSDLPLLNANTLDLIMQKRDTLQGPKRAVLARSKDGGTSVLLVNQATSFGYRFGADSYAAHRAECTRLEYTVASFEQLSTSLDIDTPDDFELLRLAAQAGRCGPRTTALMTALCPYVSMHAMEPAL
jgi:2-phospho-L-lactate guanylyltransferase